MLGTTWFPAWPQVVALPAVVEALAVNSPKRPGAPTALGMSSGLGEQCLLVLASGFARCIGYWGGVRRGGNGLCGGIVCMCAASWVYARKETGEWGRVEGELTPDYVSGDEVSFSGPTHFLFTIVELRVEPKSGGRA